MGKSKVAIIHCPDYDEEEVFRAVRRGIELLGGPESFASRGERILLKPNVLFGDPPQRCTTTHPAVLKAVGRLFKALTPHVSYGDSSGFGKPAVQMRRARLAQAADEIGIPLAEFTRGREVQLPGSPFTQRFTLAEGVLEADGVINLPKLKTHQLTRITGAVKNLFGCIPGLLKAEFHVKIQDPRDFARMLVALNLLVRPRLHILDGIVAMEGNGPRSGDPVAMEVLLFSRDPIALDSVFCRLIDLDPQHVPTMAPGSAWGLGTYRWEEIELVGDPIEPLIQPSFNVPRRPVVAQKRHSRYAVFKGPLSRRPVIDARRCARCGVCVKTCPVSPKALSWADGSHARPPVYDYRLCIRCFCCQELCPEKAISVRTPRLGKLLLGG